MVHNAQLYDRTPADSSPARPDPYEMGRVVQQLSHNTAAVHDLARAVQQQTETLTTMSRDLTELRDGLKHANNDIRSLRESAVKGDGLDARLRELGLDPVDADTHRKNQSYLTNRRRADEERNGTRRHVRNVLAGAIALALMWWGWDAMLHKVSDTVKQAAAAEEVRNK